MGMVGALVMPHNIYLHSALVQDAPQPLLTTGDKREAMLYNGIESAVSLGVTVFINLALMAVFASGFYNQDHGIAKVGLSSAGRCISPLAATADTSLLLVSLHSKFVMCSL